MRKNFTVILPDEPYKTATALNNAIQCTYEGSRYIVARMEDSSKKVVNAVATFDTLSDIRLESYVEEGHSFFVIDAATHTFEAAVLTYSYKHGQIDDYEETLPTGETWTHAYASETGVIDHIYMPFTLEYDSSTQTFKEPVRRTHFITRESFFESIQNIVPKIEEALDVNDYTDEERTALENHKTWLENLSTTYANVDHWKIPFPTNLPPF